MRVDNAAALASWPIASATPGPLYCECETPMLDVEHDAGCQRCGRPVNFTPAPPGEQLDLEPELALDGECEGHPAGPHDPMGETVYCDGSCRRGVSS